MYRCNHFTVCKGDPVGLFHLQHRPNICRWPQMAFVSILSLGRCHDTVDHCRRKDPRFIGRDAAGDIAATTAIRDSVIPQHRSFIPVDGRRRPRFFLWCGYFRGVVCRCLDADISGGHEDASPDLGDERGGELDVDDDVTKGPPLSHHFTLHGIAEERPCRC